MSRPVAGDRLFSLETLLGIVSKIYGVVVKARLSLFHSGVLKSKKLPCVVISVGNITAGGTGKTPMTLHVADLVRQMGYKVAVISRGYKGKFEKSGGIVCDGRRICCTPEESGDEPYLIAQTLGVPVLVGKDRYVAGMKAIREFGARVIVLDDAFQHIKVKRDLDLILLDGGHPFGNGALIPRGRLREPVSSLERGDVIVFTRCKAGQRLKDWELSQLDKHTKNKPLFRTSHSPRISQIVTGSARKSDTKTIENFLKKNRNKKGLLFSGIANNKDFRKTCETMGMGIAGHLEFPDHYWYKPDDITMLLERFKTLGADFLVTTQKDYVKIADRFVIPERLVVVDVAMDFTEDHGGAFESLIKKRIESHE